MMTEEEIEYYAFDATRGEDMSLSPSDIGISFDRDGCEWFESPVYEVMDDEPDTWMGRKAVLDLVMQIFE